MKSRTFLIPTLVAAGFSAQEPSAAKSAVFANPFPHFDPNSRALLAAFKQDPMFQLAGHSSHASHASHASHRSSTGGTYDYPAPAYPAPTYQTPTYSTPP